MLATNNIIGGIDFSPSEMQIIAELLRGHCTRQGLADALHKKPTTVDSQLRFMFRKAGVHTLVEFLLWLVRQGMMPPRTRR